MKDNHTGKAMTDKEISAAISHMKQERNTQKEGRTKSGRRIQLYNSEVKKRRKMDIAKGRCGCQLVMYIKTDANGREYVAGAHSSKSKQYYKKLSARKNRHDQTECCLKGNGYRRVFDYWWALY